MARERCGESGESAKERFSEEERTSNLCTDGRDSTIILSYQPSRTEEEDSEPCAECFSKRGGLIRRDEEEHSLQVLTSGFLLDSCQS